MGTKLTWEIYIKSLVKSGPLQPEQYLVTVLQQFNHREIQCLEGRKRKRRESCLSDTCCFPMKMSFPFIVYITEANITKMCYLQNKTRSH